MLNKNTGSALMTLASFVYIYSLFFSSRPIFVTIPVTRAFPIRKALFPASTPSIAV